MTLFAKGVRIRQNPMRDGERLFDFHNESAWPACETFRDTVNRWVSDFDLNDQTKLISQMKAENNQFRHTLLELVVSALLRALKFKIAPHPHLVDSTKTPDFIISDESCSGYVEVTTINPSDESQRTANREAILLKKIDSIVLPSGFILSYNSLRLGSSSIQTKRITQEIIDWVEKEKSCIQDQVARKFCEADWEIEINLIRTGSDHVYDRAIGIRLGDAGWVQTASDLRTALLHKRKRYGDLNAPFLLVVGDSKGSVWGRERISEELAAAVFGSEVVRWSADIEPHPERAMDGFWLGQNGRRNTTVSAVLFFPDIGVFGLRNELHLPQLAVNPWATHPVPSALKELPRIELEGGRLTFSGGVSVADLIGLPVDWPGPPGV